MAREIRPTDGDANAMAGACQHLDDLRAHKSRATENRDEFGLVHGAVSGEK
jgi:hypothetical protein